MLAVLLFSLLSLISAEIYSTVSMQKQFLNWKLKYNKSYSRTEEEIRFSNFQDSIERIRISNSKNHGQKGIARFGLTKFSDLSVEEFKSTILMKNKIVPDVNHPGPKIQKTKKAIPNVFDWRNKGVVTKVKNQGQCGSCWAFSATETIESAWIMKHKLSNVTMVPLAPQQIVDCDTSDSGCGGGNTPGAYDYIMSTGGLETNYSYPYTAQDGTCAFSQSKVYANIVSWDYACYIEMEHELLETTYTTGPTSICVDASNWQDYESGVMTGWQCAWVDLLDHCVQAVGWNLNAPVPYWMVRNSWSTDWGENGYIRLEYGDNTCGLTFDATYVTSA